MTTLEDRLASVTPLRRTPDPRARLLAESNRVLAAAVRTEATAADVLQDLVGALINSMPANGVLPEHDLVALMERTADRLGCPPAVVVSRQRRGRGSGR